MLARHLVGELERRQRLEQREQRTAEQPGLLTRDDGDGLRVGQRSRGLDGCRRRAAAPLLRGDDRGDLLRAGARAPASGAIACAHAARIGRIARKKRRDRREVVGVVGSQPPDPGKRRTSTATR